MTNDTLQVLSRFTTLHFPPIADTSASQREPLVAYQVIASAPPGATTHREARRHPTSASLSISVEYLLLHRHVGSAGNKLFGLGFLSLPLLPVWEQRCDKSGRVDIVPSYNRVAPRYRQAEIRLTTCIAPEPRLRDADP
jgi:hypothetical protein